MTEKEIKTEVKEEAVPVPVKKEGGPEVEEQHQEGQQQSRDSRRQDWRPRERGRRPPSAEERRRARARREALMTDSEKRDRHAHVVALGQEELLGDAAFAARVARYRHLKDGAAPQTALERKPAAERRAWEARQVARERAQYAAAVAADRTAAVQAAAAEVLQTEARGFIEAEGPDERTDTLRQQDIAAAVDVQAAQRAFDLRLPDFGPYVHDYTRSGRYLLLGGRKGHLAVLDWQQKRLLTELHVGETVHDVRFLQNEGMFAVAQKRWVHIYNRDGAEMHCLEAFRLPLALEYLPYHFLLAAASETGRVRYIDVSTGTELPELATRMGPCGVMAQNPWNAVLCLGHVRGCVTMWSPNQGTPLVRMVCHRGAVTALAVDRGGLYMATAGVDRTVKIWDIRALRPLATVPVRSTVTSLSIRQTGLLAAGSLAHVNIWRESLFRERVVTPYLSHTLPGSAVQRVRFCPYEDYLGVGHRTGFTSMVVPGAGEPNYDTFEANPFETRRLRRETEVHQLLEKIPADMITLNPGTVATVATPAEVELRRRQTLARAAHICAAAKGTAVRDAEARKRVREAAAEDAEGAAAQPDDSDAEDGEEDGPTIDTLGEGEGEGEDGAIVGRPRTRSQRKKLSRARKVLILEETAEQEKALRKRAKKAKAAVSQVNSALDLFTKKVRY